MSDVLTTTCRECGVPLQLDVTGYSEKAVRIASAHLPGMMCERCNDIADEAERDERNRAAQVQADGIYADRLRHSRVPRPPVDFAWPQCDAGQAATAWAQRRSLRLTITGPVGTGKTTLAAAAFRERLRPIIEDGKVTSRAGAWRGMAAYMAQLGAGFGTPAKDDAVWLCQGGIVLGLDDLDKTRPTDYAAEQVYALVNGAYETRAPLIVTMNCTTAQLAAKWGGVGSLGDAIASRLEEGVVVEYGGDDRRIAKGSR